MLKEDDRWKKKSNPIVMMVLNNPTIIMDNTTIIMNSPNRKFNNLKIQSYANKQINRIMK